MILTSKEIEDRNIVVGAQPQGKRPTTYDATVGSIIQGGKEIKTNEYVLPQRGIVWVVSAETFKIPKDITGLATLRTTWTHDGVLTLNVGIVDPGWQGPLAAAVVNFGNSDFQFKKGDSFLRIMFHSHKETGTPSVEKAVEKYRKDIIANSKTFSSTFLNMESLVPEISEKVYSMPKWLNRFTVIGLVVAVVGLMLAALATFAPMALSVYTDYYVGRERLEAIEKQVDELKRDSVNSSSLRALERRILELESPADRVTPLP